MMKTRTRRRVGRVQAHRDSQTCHHVPWPASGLIEPTVMAAYTQAFEAEPLCTVGARLSEARLIDKFELGKSPLCSTAMRSESTGLTRDLDSNQVAAWEITRRTVRVHSIYSSACPPPSRKSVTCTAEARFPFPPLVHFMVCKLWIPPGSRPPRRHPSWARNGQLPLKRAACLVSRDLS